MNAKPSPVRLGFGSSRARGEHIAKRFNSQGEAMVYLQENVFMGVAYWIDDAKTGECVAHGVVRWK